MPSDPHPMSKALRNFDECGKAFQVTLLQAADELDRLYAELAAELAAVAGLVEAAREAVQDIERSHAEKNDRIGRPQEHSHTLKMARSALAALSAVTDNHTARRLAGREKEPQ